MKIRIVCFYAVAAPLITLCFFAVIDRCKDSGALFTMVGAVLGPVGVLTIPAPDRVKDLGGSTKDVVGWLLKGFVVVVLVLFLYKFLDARHWYA